MKSRIKARISLYLLVLAGSVCLGGLVLLFGTTPRYVQRDFRHSMRGERLYASQGEAKRVAQLIESSKFRQLIAGRVNERFGDRWFRGEDLRIQATVGKVGPHRPAFATHSVSYDVSFRQWAKTDLLNIRSLKETILRDGPGYTWSKETDAANGALIDAVVDAVDEFRPVDTVRQ